MYYFIRNQQISKVVVPFYFKSLWLHFVCCKLGIMYIPLSWRLSNEEVRYLQLSGLALIVAVRISSPVGWCAPLIGVDGEREARTQLHSQAAMGPGCRPWTRGGTPWRCLSSPAPQWDFMVSPPREAIQLIMIICTSETERAEDCQPPENTPAPTLKRDLQVWCPGRHESPCFNWPGRDILNKIHSLFPESRRCGVLLAALIKALHSHR